jgi:phosphotransferase system HPr-like phosphotransfer protein
MRVHGVTQTTETRELTAEGDDAETARALIEEQVPDGFELLQVHNAMPRGGRVIATAIIREAATKQIEADGADYAAARDALRARVPDGHRLLSIVVDD